jgi:hypothetical protein
MHRKFVFASVLASSLLFGLNYGIAQDSKAPSANTPSNKSIKAKSTNVKAKSDPKCNTDCQHLCMNAGDSLPAMIGNNGVVFRLPNGTWCRMSSH